MSLAEATARLAMTVASRDRLSVLIYHRVPAEPDELLPGEPCAAEFERTMRWVKSVFNVIPLADGVAGIKSGKLPPRALSITFDDGYANNATVAAPILQTARAARDVLHCDRLPRRRAACSTTQSSRQCAAFEATCSTSRSWAWGAIRPRPCRIGARRSMQYWQGVKYRPDAERGQCADAGGSRSGACRSDRPDDDVRASGRTCDAADSNLGGHTVTHPILAQLDAGSARDEIVRGRRRVEELAGSRARLFAYPNGKPERDYVWASARLVRELGFDGAVTTSQRAAHTGSSPYEVPRFTPWDKRLDRFTFQLWNNAARTQPTYMDA